MIRKDGVRRVEMQDCNLGVQTLTIRLYFSSDCRKSLDVVTNVPKLLLAGGKPLHPHSYTSSMTIMKDFPSLTQWLSDRKDDAGRSPAELEALKESYWKEYHRAYHLHRKQKWKRLTLRMSPSEHRVFSEHLRVRCRRLSLNAAIKQWALAYLNEQYVPRDPESIQQLVQQVQKIGNNVNQVVHQLHRDRKHQAMNGSSEQQNSRLLHDKYEELVAQIHKLKQRVEQYFTSPPLRLNTALIEAVRDRPELIQELQAQLAELAAHTSSTS